MKISRSQAGEFARLERKEAGFSLVELLIVVAVMVLLATVAYPSYQNAVRKAKRSEAKTALLMLMQQQERYYTQRNTYIVFPSVATDVDAARFKAYSGSNPASSAYNISGAACANESIQSCVLLIAAPVGTPASGGFTDPDCKILSLSSTGVRSATGTMGDQCWQ